MVNPHPYLSGHLSSNVSDIRQYRLYGKFSLDKTEGHISNMECTIENFRAVSTTREIVKAIKNEAINRQVNKYFKKSYLCCTFCFSCNKDHRCHEKA